MSERFRALVLDKTDQGQEPSLKALTLDDLMPGDTVVAPAFSTLNYKDGLALTGAAPVVRSFPMIPGIDFAGEVISCEGGAFQPGDQVILNGFGLGETHFGGYAERARVNAKWLVRLPDGISPRHAMAVGTAGYTAMLCVLALEEGGTTPDHGPILVTGAAGGVGSVAVALLAKLGFEIIASTGRASEADYLKSLGANEIIARDELSGEPRAMAKERFAGVVDCVGSKTLANAISMTKYGGTIAACGLAGGMDLPTSVAPFILRGVKLIGIESVHAPLARRELAWARLAQDLDLEKLEAMITDVPLSEISEWGSKILSGQTRGRVVVDVSK